MRRLSLAVLVVAAISANSVPASAQSSSANKNLWKPILSAGQAKNASPSSLLKSKRMTKFVNPFEISGLSQLSANPFGLPSMARRTTPAIGGMSSLTTTPSISQSSASPIVTASAPIVVATPPVVTSALPQLPTAATATVNTLNSTPSLAAPVVVVPPPYTPPKRSPFRPAPRPPF